MALAAPPFGTEKGHYQVDFDKDKKKEDVWLVVAPAQLPKDVVVFYLTEHDKTRPKAGKLALVTRLNGKTYVFAGNEFFSSPSWQAKDVAELVHVQGNNLKVFTESGADMDLRWTGKNFEFVGLEEP